MLYLIVSKYALPNYDLPFFSYVVEMGHINATGHVIVFKTRLMKHIVKLKIKKKQQKKHIVTLAL